jgi:hypothetical protein
MYGVIWTAVAIATVTIAVVTIATVEIVVHTHPCQKDWEVVATVAVGEVK